MTLTIFDTVTFQRDPLHFQFDPSVNALYHHPSLGMILMDLAGHYVLVSPAAARMLGEQEDCLVGKAHSEVFPDVSHQAAFQEAASRHWVCYSHQRTLTVPTESGDYWDISISLRRGLDGMPCGYMMLLQEVSSFRHALQEAARQRKLFSTLLEEVPAGVIIAQGEQGRVTMMNAAARRLYGDALQTGSSILRQLEQVDEARRMLHPSDWHPVLTTLRTGKRVEEATVRCVAAQGRELTLQMDCAPLGMWDNEPTAIAVFQDITGHAQYERELERQNIRLQELDHAKDAFLANVSHELKTPLTAILGWVNTARELNDPLLTGQALEVIERNAQRQAWMIDDLLTLSNCLAGRLILRPEMVRVRAVCQEAVARAYLALKNPATELQMSVPEELLCIADPFRLRQLLENLLTNALKFTPSSGAIAIDARDEGVWIAIDIRDTGIGIDRKHITSVFSPFWQADASPSRKYSGTGIGLTVVKELVTLHGGEIFVHSAGLNQGTCFTVRLPKNGGQSNNRCAA